MSQSRYVLLFLTALILGFVCGFLGFHLGIPGLS